MKQTAFLFAGLILGAVIVADVMSTMATPRGEISCEDGRLVVKNVYIHDVPISPFDEATRTCSTQ